MLRKVITKGSAKNNVANFELKIFLLLLLLLLFIYYYLFTIIKEQLKTIILSGFL
jgi:hypothetical protein